MRLFSLDLKEGENSGDGFTPPFIKDGSNWYFMPVVVMGSMSSRNLLYSLLQADQQAYDEQVSAF